ncbi:MAG: fluoride efflux transporter CrcB [Muribaculaceae bacterium]|nr:fluoride efflux transporter CrcB [Muribaculaceae bacterium]
MKTLFWDSIFVGLGSMIGGVSRFLVTKWLLTSCGDSYPWGTLTVNLVGCLLIGMLGGYFSREGIMSESMRLFLTIGFCGGFTTFSTFINENFFMLSNSQIISSILYTTVSFIGGLALIFIGNMIIKAF